jgi:Predicted membrane protein (DUF2243)
MAEEEEFPASAGILLDLGLGGFFDGIVLHQILQWHHMVTGRISAGQRREPEAQHPPRRPLPRLPTSSFCSGSSSFGAPHASA